MRMTGSYCGIALSLTGRMILVEEETEIYEVETKSSGQTGPEGKRGAGIILMPWTGEVMIVDSETGSLTSIPVSTDDKNRRPSGSYGPSGEECPTCGLRADCDYCTGKTSRVNPVRNA